jgi:hypothetical protein
VFTVPEICKIGELSTEEEIITGVPVLVVVPEALVKVTVVVVEAVRTNVPLFPVALPVYPERVTEAPFHPLEPAPDSVAANVYVHEVPLPPFDGATLVLNATVVEAPVTVGVVFDHTHAAARAVAYWKAVVSVPMVNARLPVGLVIPLQGTLPADPEVLAALFGISPDTSALHVGAVAALPAPKLVKNSRVDVVLPASLVAAPEFPP